MSKHIFRESTGPYLIVFDGSGVYLADRLEDDAVLHWYLKDHPLARPRWGNFNSVSYKRPNKLSKVDQ